MLFIRYVLSLIVLLVVFPAFSNPSDGGKEEMRGIQVAPDLKDYIRRDLQYLLSDNASARERAIVSLRALSDREDFEAALREVLAGTPELSRRITYEEVMRQIEGKNAVGVEPRREMDHQTQTTDEEMLRYLRVLDGQETGDKGIALERLKVLSEDDQSFGILVRSLNRDVELRADFVKIMEEIGVRNSKDFIASELLRYPQPEIRREAATALGRIGDKLYLEPLLASLQGDNDDLVRAYSARSLGSLGDEATVRPLMSALSRDVLMVRFYSVGSLGSFDNPDALGAVAAAMMRDHNYVQHRAAQALIESGDKRTILMVNGWLGDNFGRDVTNSDSFSCANQSEDFVASLGDLGEGPGILAFTNEQVSPLQYYLCVKLNAIWLVVETDPPGADVYLVERYFFEEADDDNSFLNKPDLYRVNPSNTMMPVQRMKYYILFRLEGYQESRPRLIDADIDPLQDTVCRIPVSEELRPIK